MHLLAKIVLYLSKCTEKQRIKLAFLVLSLALCSVTCLWRATFALAPPFLRFCTSSYELKVSLSDPDYQQSTTVQHECQQEHDHCFTSTMTAYLRNCTVLKNTNVYSPMYTNLRAFHVTSTSYCPLATKVSQIKISNLSGETFKCFEVL